MKRKWILRGILGVGAVVIMALVVLAFSLGAIVKRAVEKIGPDATKVDVRLKSAEVWVFAERIQLTKFVLGNPAGCKMPTAFEVDSVTVRVKGASVFSKKLIVDSIHVKEPVITLEGGLKENNLTRIQKNLNDYVGGESDATPATNTAAGPSSPASSEKKLQVNDLEITGAKLLVNTTLSAGRTITLPIPDIHLTNLGTGPEGITPAEVGQRALRAILSAATKAMATHAEALGKEALGEAKTAAKKIDLNKLKDKLKGLFH